MADEVFRQRKKITPDEVGDSSSIEKNIMGTPPMSEGDPLESVRKVQEAIAQERGDNTPFSKNFENPDAPFQMSGNVPQGLQEALTKKSQERMSASDTPSFAPPSMEGQNFQSPPKRKPVPDSKAQASGSDELEDLFKRLSGIYTWEEFEFPSGAKFYKNIPPVIHIRPMTGEEEQILATPRYVRKGKAIDMIFNRCIKEKIATEDLLSIDRTHLLIYLRGISYTPEYDVEIKCPECTMKFSTVIDLNTMNVNICPEDFDQSSLEGELPSSGFKYRYRLATGADEQAITNYRDNRISMFGDQSEDDTLLYRTAILLDYIEGVTNPKELNLLLKRLPINDVSYLRNEINDPPFGVDTDIPIMCPSCNEEFKVDLPLETNFFFPRKKEAKTQV